MQATPTVSAHDRLFQLFKDSDEASLKRNPIQALFRGDMRYADRLGDLFSDAHFQGEKAAADRDLEALHAIPRGELNPSDQIAYDVFEYQTNDTLRALQPDLLTLTEALPMNHFFGIHTAYPTLASGQGGAPFKTVEDYENNLKRNRDFATNVDEAIAQWKKGEAEGVVDTKLTVRNMIEQLDNQLKLKPEESPYWGPIKSFPDSIGAADRARLTTEYRDSIAGVIYPALTRMHDFLKSEYLGHAREGVGLSYMKGGDALYRYDVQSTTTLPTTPDEIHNLGLSEVARITNEFEKVRQEVGFKGDLHAFFDYMRTSPKFQPKSREQLTAGLSIGIEDRGRGEGPAIFLDGPEDAAGDPALSAVPREVRGRRQLRAAERPTDRGRAPSISTPTTCRRAAPGKKPLCSSTRASPGHHFQISLAQENPSLPSFMRFGGNTAYVEGWALYSETLGYDMGFYKDPYARFGTLNDEMLRAMRLVVDTGIHTKGWTREQAIDYMLSHSGMGKTDATAEVERYIAIPSQATAYKIGALTIQRLRKKAQDELGPKFDIRDFHAQILGSGALPLAILEKKVDAWIAAKKAS